MTDKEIVQALEWCVSDNDCIKCPCNKVYKFGCTNSQFTSDTLDLIKRQQRKLKSWQQGNVQLRDMLDNRQADNEKLKKLLEESEARYKEVAKRFYKVGVRELAERLCKDRVSNDPVVIAVKAELKEMVRDME